MEQTTEQVYCSDLSLQAQEALIATATPTSQYLYIEYNGAWEARAFEQSDIPEAVRRHLNAYAKSRADCKVMLMRSPRSLAEAGMRFLAARLGEGPSQIYELRLQRYEDLLQIDLEQVLRGEGPYAAWRRSAPVYMVCTNGRRDRCCARYGVGVFNALQEAARSADQPIDVWQSSHIGGHRFAANLICLSSGLLYGRMRPEDAPALLEAERRGEIWLDRLRGRLSYPPAAQAAEAALRRQTGELGLQAYTLEALVEDASGEWSLTFLSQRDERYRVRVRAHKTEQRVYESCSLDKTTAVVEYEAVVESL